MGLNQGEWNIFYPPWSQTDLKHKCFHFSSHFSELRLILNKNSMNHFNPILCFFYTILLIFWVVAHTAPPPSPSSNIISIDLMHYPWNCNCIQYTFSRFLHTFLKGTKFSPQILFLQSLYLCNMIV